MEERAIRLRSLEDDVKPEKRGESRVSYASDIKNGKTSRRKTFECWMEPSHKGKGHWTSKGSKWKSLKPAERRSFCMKKKLCIVCLDPWNKDHECVIPDWLETKLNPIRGRGGGIRPP